MPVSSAACVPPSMPASCSANSLSTTDATSCSMRSRTVRAGWNALYASNLWVLCDVGQYRYSRYHPW